MTAWNTPTSIVVVGGGFSGTLFALTAAARGLDVVLVERARDAGRGLAYGACAPVHILNVPVARMEVGLKPSFAEWLAASGADLSDALAEAGGDLARAFVPRALFGAYMAERFEEALRAPGGRLRRLRGAVTRISCAPVPVVHLADGRRLDATHVVLATGNLPPRTLRCRDEGIQDDPAFIPDPWRAADYDTLPSDAPVLLIGSGLTMVDVALMLTARGHAGPIWAVSRHGLLPLTHVAATAARAGAAPVLDLAGAAEGPGRAMRLLRTAAARAARDGVPWQGVMDAMRPHLAAIWTRWPDVARARFLRHARAYWDVHRHRMAPRVAAAQEALVETGRLRVMAGRITALERVPGAIAVTVRPRGSAGFVTREVARIVNCTGPRSDFADLALPPFDGLIEAGDIVPDPLGLGPRTRGAAMVDRTGRASDWLFALGPLARAALWEVTAVPEIAVQVRTLADQLAAAHPADPQEADLVAGFVDLGEGI